MYIVKLKPKSIKTIEDLRFQYISEVTILSRNCIPLIKPQNNC